MPYLLKKEMSFTKCKVNMNVLFICSRNKWRSKTAEDIFKSYDGFQVRSAGTSDSARIKVNEKLLTWADIVFVMEKRHKQILTQRFSSIIETKEVQILNIPDDYQYMDDELIERLKDSWSAFLEG